MSWNRKTLIAAVALMVLMQAASAGPGRDTYGVDLASDQPFPSDLPPNEHVQVTREGVSLTYHLILTNKGEVNDTYDIGCDGAPPGWHAVMNLSYIYLLPGQQWPISLKVDPPASLAGGLLSWALITVWARSRYDITCATHYHTLTILNTTMNPAVIKYAGPGQSARYPLKVSNTGSSGDNITLDTVYIHNEPWNVTHQPDEGHPLTWGYALANAHFPLLPGGTSNTTMKVTAPADATETHSFLILNLTVRSDSDPSKTDRITLITLVALRFGVKLDCAFPVKKTLGGEHARFSINVTNTGTMRDTISLSRTDPPANWSATLGQLSVTLDAGDTKVIELDVLPPIDALPNSTAVIIVTGTSTGNTSIKDSVQTLTIANPNYLLRFNATELIQYVDPGNTTRFNIEVLNLGVMQDTALLSFTGGAAGWNAVLNGSPLLVQPKSSGFVTLDVTAPPNALAGETVVHWVQCVSQTDPFGIEVILAKTITNPTLNNTAELAPGFLRVDPEQPAPFTLTLRNRGNGAELVSLEPGQLPSRWTMKFNETDVVVQPFSSRTVTCTVTPDFNALAGNFSFTAFARTSWTRIEVGAIVWVNRVYRFTMECAEPEQTVMPGGQREYNVTITNRGNADDSVVLSTFPSDSEPGWNWSVDRNIVGLPLGGNTTVKVRVNVPAGAAAGVRKECRLRGTSEGNTSFWREVPLTAIVGTMRALNVTGTPEYLDRAPGVPAEFSIAVRNIGNIAEDVSLAVTDSPAGWTVSFKSSAGALLPSFRLPPTELQSVLFTATPPPGTVAGNYTFNVSVTTAGGLRYDLRFRVNVLPFYSFEVVPEKDYVVIPSGTSLNVRIFVRNTGNIADVITLFVCGTMGERWAGFLHPTVSLGANSSTEVLLNLRAPADSRASVHLFDVRGRSTTGTEKNATVKARIIEKGATTTIDAPCMILIVLLVLAAAFAGFMAWRIKKRADDIDREKGSRKLGRHTGESIEMRPQAPARQVRQKRLPPPPVPPLDVDAVEVAEVAPEPPAAPPPRRRAAPDMAPVGREASGTSPSASPRTRTGPRQAPSPGRPSSPPPRF